MKTRNATSRPDEDDDLITLILDDHRPLKEMIRVLKDAGRSLGERRGVFEDFARHLTVHARPEEEVLYARMKDDPVLRTEAFEGEVEHGLTDQMLEEAKRTDDANLWSARVKVMAELLENHIHLEETELLPDFKARTTLEERARMGREFVDRKTRLVDQGGADTVEENHEYQVFETELLDEGARHGEYPGI